MERTVEITRVTDNSLEEMLVADLLSETAATATAQKEGVKMLHCTIAVDWNSHWATRKHHGSFTSWSPGVQNGI